MTVAERVRSQIDPRCVATKCARDGCSLSLLGIPRTHLVVDMDSSASPAAQDKSRPDYWFIGTISASGPEYAAVIELKRGDVDTSDTVKQLNAGAALAQKYILPSDEIRFLPVLIHGRLHPEQMRKLKNPANGILFRGKRVLIRRAKCQGSLLRIVSKE